MTTITANFPARTQRLSGGKSKSFPAYSADFNCDESGKWATRGYAVTEADVIDACKKASNWDAIRAEHFTMAGFHA